MQIFIGVVSVTRYQNLSRMYMDCIEIIRLCWFPPPVCYVLAGVLWFYYHRAVLVFVKMCRTRKV